MPNSLITNNIGAIKVNNMTGSASVVVGDAVFIGTQSQVKNLTSGPFNTGDGGLMNNPNVPFFNDPDVFDSNSGII